MVGGGRLVALVVIEIDEIGSKADSKAGNGAAEGIEDELVSALIHAFEEGN